MTLFWTIAAGLTLLAMGFVVLPLLRSHISQTITSDELNLEVFKQQLQELDDDLNAGLLDQVRYDAARKDLEKGLLQDVNSKAEASPQADSRGRWALASALLVPLVGIALYLNVGSPQIIPQLAANQTGAAPASPSTKDLPPMEELVARLAQKMQEQPENLEGWLMLGRSYLSMKRYPDAIAALDRAVALAPDNVSVLLASAEAVGASTGNNFTGAAAARIEKAVSLSPGDPSARWMMGIVAYQRGQYQEAISQWQAAKQALGAESDDLASIDSAIADAREQLGGRAKLPSIKQSTDTPANAPEMAAAGMGIIVEVSIDPELLKQARSEDTVFIYAKALQGPPMPLAAARKQVKDLPLKLTLDDSMAMMPQLKLSNFTQVKVGARIARSGGPTAKSGDFEGEISPVTTTGGTTVQIIIDRVHP